MTFVCFNYFSLIILYKSYNATTHVIFSYVQRDFHVVRKNVCRRYSKTDFDENVLRSCLVYVKARYIFGSKNKEMDYNILNSYFKHIVF